MTNEFIKFDCLTKRFAGVTALDDVSLSIARGECHGLMGENGAGKSTLGKVLAGIYRPDGGTFSVDGVGQSFSSPRDALRAGIGMVHQELAFCPDLSVAENLVMGRYPRRFGMLLNRRRMFLEAEQLLGQIGVSLDVTQPMRALSTAQEQLVQIASAVGISAKVIVFDEPTSSLSEPEAERLFALIDNLRTKGVTTLYVSHRMPEVFRLCDRISVLRDGRYVGTLSRAEATQAKIVQMMIGRSVESYLPHHVSGQCGDIVLRAAQFVVAGQVQNVNLDIRAGEIVGLAGLVGAGRTEVAAAIFGLDRRASGEVQIAGQPLPLGSVRQAMRAGVGLVPEDRKRQGLVLPMSGRANFSLAMLDRLNRMGLLDGKAERRGAEDYFARLRVKTPSLDAVVAGLSGGNQQKIALAKWLARGSKLLIVDEPTRGVDVGAKAAIHELIDQLAQQGVAIMLISSELPEVIAMSSRLLVMREGRIVAEVPRADVTQSHVLRLMAGVAQEPETSNSPA